MAGRETLYGFIKGCGERSYLRTLPVLLGSGYLDGTAHSKEFFAIIFSWLFPQAEHALLGIKGLESSLASTNPRPWQAIFMIF
jgi:hypothetical protein